MAIALVTFERALPQQCEQALCTLTMAIGALAAHSVGARCFAYGASLGEPVEEAELALRRPAIAADRSRIG